MSAASTPRFPLRLTIAVAVVFAILCGLGTWQVVRLRQKTALIARVTQRSRAPARPLDAVLAEAARGADVAFARVEFDCPGLASAPYARVYDLRQGQIGARLFSACPLGSGAGRAILVDRGFVADTVKRLPVTNAQDTRPVHVVGQLRLPEKPGVLTPSHRPGQPLWFAPDVVGVAAELHAPDPAAWYVAAETASNPDKPELNAGPRPVNLSNRHLGYVITWYGLAVALLGVYAGLLRKRMSPP